MACAQHPLCWKLTDACIAQTSYALLTHVSPKEELDGHQDFSSEQGVYHIMRTHTHTYLQISFTAFCMMSMELEHLWVPYTNVHTQTYISTGLHVHNMHM